MSGLAGPGQMRTNRPEEMFCRPSPRVGQASPTLQRRGARLVSVSGSDLAGTTGGRAANGNAPGKQSTGRRTEPHRRSLGGSCRTIGLANKLDCPTATGYATPLI